MNNYNNFELLLSAASEECCDKLAKQFLSMDVNEEITPAERKRFNKINRKASKKNYTTWKPLKVAAVACLICLSLCFVACMCITRVRTAIKETIIEWYEDFASIKFENKDSQPLNDDIHVPDRIVSKARASYLPSRYTCEVKMDTYKYYIVSYYLEDEFMFSLSQKIISNEPQWVNSKNQIFHQITVNVHRRGR